MTSTRGKAFFLIFLILFALSSTGFAENGAKEDQMDTSRDLFEGFVYYADKQMTGLKSIIRLFPSALDSHELAQEILKALIAGPSVSFLEPVWPGETHINSFFITDDGSAYVDLTLSAKMSDQMDTQSELLAIYSMVNSLTLNIPEIKRVKILIQGSDALTLAGHLDLEYFYTSNMMIVK